MTETTILAPHIAQTPGVRGGRPCIDGTGVTVEFVALMHERVGKTAAEIAADYEVSFAEIYAALAYYYDHREEIDSRTEQDRAFVEQVMQRGKVKGNRLSA